MLTKIKKHVFKTLHYYHYNMANYYYRKVDKYGPESNDYWKDKVNKHVVKDMVIVSKLSKLRET